MGKITKPMQAKHKETLSPWLAAFVQEASSTPLPVLPKLLAEFPSRWPFGRGDLYHWTPLLNLFDEILEQFCKIYKLAEGPQTRDFGCELLLNQHLNPAFEGARQWTQEELTAAGITEDGDSQLIVTVLTFTRMLLENCGNRSIYASSNHLNDLLNTTSLNILVATLEVGYELAQRYQASVKRIPHASRHVSSALLANHYNIELDRVHQIALPFVKTPLIRPSDSLATSSPNPLVKGKDKPRQNQHQNQATTHANDLTAIVDSDGALWKGWADVKVSYYPETVFGKSNADEAGNGSMPMTPTPLRRSSTMTPQHSSSRSRNFLPDEASPLSPRTPGTPQTHLETGEKSFEVPHSVVTSNSIYDLLQRLPADMPAAARYEAFHRLRVAKALTGTREQRQCLLATRLLATTNLAYIHTEPSFIEKVLRYDIDETRRFQLVYQLAELIRPQAESNTVVPLWLQTISLALLEVIAPMSAKTSDVVAALNANVNHGILLYIVRKAVAGMKEDDPSEDGKKITQLDQWRRKLLSLTNNMALQLRVGPEMVSAGLMEILVELLKIRSKVAQRYHNSVLTFLDNLVWNYQNAFTTFFNMNGLDVVAQLVVDAVAEARALQADGKGTPVDHRSSAVDYSVPYYQQQTLKGLLKFVHHILSNSFSFSGNTDRLLRNLVDKADLLRSLKTVIEDKQAFGSVAWTYTVTLLSDFINNDPTSFSAISESGMIRTYLEAITGRQVPDIGLSELAQDQEVGAESSSADTSAVATQADDERPHPPTEESLRQSKRTKVAEGILPSAEAMSVIPQVLNSICLNNAGMKSVIASRAFDSFLEIFESPEHVQCMQDESDHDNAGNLGASFDELARHHPALRLAISHAVIDMVARVRFLGIEKSESAGWGVRLYNVDGSDLEQRGPLQLDNGSIMSDVDMSGSGPANVPQVTEQTDATKVAEDDLTPYVIALGNFLAAYFGNLDLKGAFIDHGGIELLLDILCSPGLSHSFSGSYGSKIMVQVISILLEHAPVRGLPAVLNRAQDAVNVLKPLADQKEGSPAFFRKFIAIQEEGAPPDHLTLATIDQGSDLVKAWLNSHQLFRILAESFTAGRHQTLYFLPVNVYDLYLKLVTSLGPLIQGIVAEEAAERDVVPKNWRPWSRFSDKESGGQSQSMDELMLPESESTNDAARSSATTTASNLPATEPTAEEKRGPHFRNYRLLCTLQQIMVPQAYPLLQSLGKALLNRRDPIHNSDDVYARARQLDIVKSMGRAFLTFLESSLESSDEGNNLNLYRYWVRMLHALQQVLVDRAPSRDRGGPTLTLPVVLAFKESQGFDVLNRMLSALADGIARDDQDPEVTKYATSAISQILDVYSALTHSKVIIEACGTYALQWPRERTHISASLAPQFVLEFRAIVLPQVAKLWQSAIMERLPDTLVKRILETLKVVTQSENEAPPTTEGQEPYEILKYDDARFNWTESRRRQVEELKQGGRDEDLALEAVFRANGDMERARLYCHSHAKGLATCRAPVPKPDIDAYKAMPQTLTTSGATTDAPAHPVDNDEMSVDQPLDDPLDAVLARMQEGAGTVRESERSSTVMTDAASTATAHHPFAATKKKLDDHRALLKENLIDRCLDITRAHPDIVLDVADLIQASIAQQPKGSTQEDVGTTLTSALTSLACDEDDKSRNARCIAGYAHLLAVLLRDEKFLDLNTQTLQSNVDEYVSYLRILPVTADALPPWIPAILLILELLLCRDARPAELQWTAPKTLDDKVEKPTLRPRTTLISAEQRTLMLEYVLDLLPRVGKDSGLAVAALRILVILTRDRHLAKVVGDKRNLQRLFLMAKQLSGFGSDRMRQTKVTSHILVILRHIIEDEETIRQVMRDEMINEYPQLRHQSGRRDLDVASFVKGMSSTALRAPDLFVEVMADVFEFSRWVAPSQETSRTHYLVLKDSKTTKTDPVAESKDDSVKPTTETLGKEAVGTSKAAESKRPVVDHPDGVVHFLLCELLAYRDVEDVTNTTPAVTEGNALAKSPSKQEVSGQGNASVDDSTTDSKDKKQNRPVFKAEENPLFIYRCFILSCLTELLQSYNKAKIEFINFKRSAPPLSATTPVKPRSTVLNYLIYDLLCQSTLSGSADTLDAKKRMATASHTQRLLVALCSRPKERTLVPEKDKFSVDEDPDLLFVRKFVLDIILKAYEKTPSSDLSMESRYSRLQSLAELMNHMIGGREKDVASSRATYNGQRHSQAQLRRLMYEKGYLDKLTSSIAEINLNFPGVKRAIKYILRVLHTLTDTAKELSQANILPSDTVDEGDGDSDLASSSSLSSLDDSDREETPDLYRNSALGMLEPRGEDEDSDSDDDEDDEEMYGDDYDEEMDYGDETLDDAEDNISDEDEDITHMGEIEGLHGEPGVVEVIMDDEGDDQTSSEDSDDDEDDVDSDDMEEVEDNVEILEEEGDPMDDDGGSGWEDDSDEDEEEDDVDDEDIDYEAEGQDAEVAQDFVALPHSFDNLARVMLGEADPEGMELGDYDDQYQEDDHDEEDDDDDDEDDLEDEYIYDDYPAAQQGPPVIGLGWDGLDPNSDGQRPLFMSEHPHRSRFVHGPFRSGGMMSGSGRMLAHREIGDFRNFFSSRGHRGSGQPPAQAEDGLNPLLRRNTAAPDQSTRRRSYPLPEWSFGDNHSRHDWDGTMAILGEIAQQLPAVQGRRGDVAFHLRFRGPMGLPERDFPSLPRPRVETRRESGEPQHSVGFPAESTADRYQEEARMVFGRAITAEANKLVPLIAAELLPAAMDLARRAKAEEAERRKQEEEERRKREEERAAKASREAEEKAAREKEEQERQAASAAAAREAAAQPGADISTSSGQDISPMEGVESSEPSRVNIQTEPTASSGGASEPRVVTMINGEEVDVTELGIDPDYLAALPEEFRAEVIAQAVSSRRSQAMEEATTGESTEVFREFLEALPDELRMEIEQQERQDQRRRVRDDNRRQATPAAAHDMITAADMDPASILMTFPPELREQVLMDQGSELMDQLPPEMAAQARALSQHMRSVIPSRSPPRVQEGSATQAQDENKDKIRPQRRAVIKMLDKAGVATLLRLMFITQQGSIRSYLFNVFADVCENRQNRLEVVSSVLQILQEGSVDMHAVERSFGQLSLKARKQNEREREGEARTPQSIKRTLTTLNVHGNAQTNSETSPLLIIQQCLDLLVDLSGKNPHVPYLFLTEHEIVGSTLKRALSRKSKGKDKDTRSHKFAINSLLSLLDRELVLESSVVMTHLADLLNRVTLPLQNLERRRKEALEAERKSSGNKAAVDESTNDTGEAAATNAAGTESAAAENPTSNSEAVTAVEDSKKKLRLMPPPIVPPHNLTLVVRIFVARECSSKTFQNTISTIKNLSVIEGAKDVFGEELVSQALLLSQNIVADLDELLPQIQKAASGTEIQGVALDKFSPGASEQNKLLRVLTALDHLFDVKKGAAAAKSSQQQDRDSFLVSLYQNLSFSTMWSKLSACLKVIHERENMLNVATILLPLIESLMVVCKNTTASDETSDGDKDLVLSSPAPESPTASLFFTFTEEHRRILNELVRNNPKLMSGTFSLLVKNPKVLEFDNKRNFFNRSVHSRASPQHTRPSYPALQLSVRREHVFLDSFKHLYFKSGDEMKYGKLNIRFNGEEGVDAGGVSREWFQVMARQMFDPNYALFTPVSSDRTTFHPNNLSGINDEHLMFFKFIGRIIGKALYEGRVLDCYFSRAVYKRILGKSVSVKDMESFDPDYYKSLCWMLENDITDTIIETFSVEDDAFGVTSTIDLIPDGRNIPVTDANKAEYIRLVVEHKLLSSVKDQMESFLKGFHEIIPAELISIFNEQELELLISGLPDIDIDDWKSNTEYQNYTPSSPQIQWFWRAVRSFDKEERAKLLQFVTGTSKVPLNGFKELEGMNGVSRFNIHRAYGDKDRLPTSHTCFNQLDIPEYESYDALRSQFMKAITAGSEYFGFA